MEWARLMTNAQSRENVKATTERYLFLTTQGGLLDYA